MAGKLYIVPTPVGNMADMTPRAVEVLTQADLILAEDTRTSAVLMQRFGITTPMQSHHKFNEHDTSAAVASRIAAGQTVALVSDAGTPGISDPGFMLSRECRRLGIEVITLPGPTAFVPALVNSGLPCDRFVFEGFLPQKKGRATRISALADDDRTFIIYESPLRLVKTLEQLAQACGADRPASVTREISKIHETTVRGTLAEIINHFTENPPRGEIVIIVAGKPDTGHKVHVNKYKPEK
ncbi:MAG: 16S rRNA (cytidine(1402)-2'-O)-methyltransferase [Muribaculaceae bacterium]|nr:16S rRNA (cytidine(1402)-2'-O)-methyltransferase [Muribaculaceae bacterium]